MGIPHSITGTSWAVNPTSTATHQFAVMYRLDGELLICRIERGAQRFGVDHDQYLVGGTPRTTLALPVQADEHAAPVIAVDGTGHLWVWANMHNNTLRVIKTNDPHTSDTWLADSGWAAASSDFPSVDIRCTYPVPVHLPHGALWFYLRNGPANTGSGHIDSYSWSLSPTGTAWASRTKLFQGIEVPDAGGSGVPGAGVPSSDEEATNWNLYPTNFYVESAPDPRPGRIHVFWVWRVEQTDGQSNVMPSYGYSDDNGTTWKAIDGTTLTVPIHPLNSVAARLPIGSAFVTEIARGSNLVVATVDTDNHGFVEGDPVTVYCNDASYAGTFTVGAVLTGPPRLAWGQTAADDPAGGTGNVCKFQWINGGAICVDPDGLPHILASIAPTKYIRRNSTNTGWTVSNVPNPLAGFSYSTVFGGAFWWRGHLWGLALSGPSPARRIRLFKITGTATQICLSGDMGNNSDWDPMFDPEAWRRFRTIETLAANGNSPRVFKAGHGLRVAAA